MLRKVLSMAMGLAGLVFFAQGTGLFTGVDSFMNYDPTWAVIGVVLAMVALVLWPRPRG